MDMMDIMYEAFNNNLPRHGPGDNNSTKKAYSYITGLLSNLSILDVGCGTGMQTLELARLTEGSILALDNHQPYLDELEKKIKNQNLSHRVKTINSSMFEMNFDSNSFDIIWSEGAAYIYGFEKALEDWQPILKEIGFFVFSELCWFKKNPPQEIINFFMNEYPAIKYVEENIKIIKSKGLDLISYFNLPDSSWLDNYYIPLEKNLNKLKKKYQNNNEVLKILSGFFKEIEMFRKYSENYGYTFFIMKK